MVRNCSSWTQALTTCQSLSFPICRCKLWVGTGWNPENTNCLQSESASYAVAKIDKCISDPFTTRLTKSEILIQFLIITSPAMDVEEEDQDSEPFPQVTTGEYSRTGYLVHLFKGRSHPCEVEVFRRICMKYGLQAWDEMQAYMPWHLRPDFRMTLCKIIKKQALAEYRNMRADPLAIRSENESKISDETDGLKMKSGMIINPKWDRSAEEIEEIRRANANAHAIHAKESERVEVPIIMSLDYLQKRVVARYTGAVLYRAFLINTLAQRHGDPNPDLMKGAKLKVLAGEMVYSRRHETILPHQGDTTGLVEDRTGEGAEVQIDE